jgi:hypothetical protein
MKLKSTVTINQEIEIDLETPAFFKSPMTSFNEYLMVKEECAIKVLIMTDYTSITNSATEKEVKEIKKAYDSWEHISEEEFMEALDKALKDFNFKPSLRVITAKEGSEVTI